MGPPARTWADAAHSTPQTPSLVCNSMLIEPVLGTCCHKGGWLHLLHLQHQTWAACYKKLAGGWGRLRTAGNRWGWRWARQRRSKGEKDRVCCNAATRAVPLAVAVTLELARRSIRHNPTTSGSMGQGRKRRGSWGCRSSVIAAGLFLLNSFTPTAPPVRGHHPSSRGKQGQGVEGQGRGWHSWKRCEQGRAACCATVMPWHPPPPRLTREVAERRESKWSLAGWARAGRHKGVV